MVSISLPPRGVTLAYSYSSLFRLRLPLCEPSLCGRAGSTRPTRPASPADRLDSAVPEDQCVWSAFIPATASITMKYQLVLQFPCDSFSDTGRASALEEELIETLGDGVYVDGHDLGVSDTSFFIFTPDPTVTFGRASEVLERWDLMESAPINCKMCGGGGVSKVLVHFTTH